LCFVRDLLARRGARVTRLRVSVFSGATAPQRAQQVNFVISCSCPVAFCGAAMACIQMRHLTCQNAKWELCCSVCYTPWLCGAAQGKTSSRLNLRGVFAWPQRTITAPRALGRAKMAAIVYSLPGG
jgi:hypothetical protein